MSEQAEGWHTDASGLRVKKWDPNLETRRRGYERQLQQHQARRLEGATPNRPTLSNQPGTLAARGAASAAPRRSSRGTRAWAARRSPTATRRRSCGARSRAPRRRRTARTTGVMADFRKAAAYGLAAPADAGRRPARCGIGARARRVVGQSRGRRGRGRRVPPGPARPGAARARRPQRPAAPRNVRVGRAARAPPPRRTTSSRLGADARGPRRRRGARRRTAPAPVPRQGARPPRA